MLHRLVLKLMIWNISMGRRLDQLTTEDVGEQFIDIVSIIPKRRKALFLSQEKLAKKAGVSIDSLKNIERLKQIPTLIVLIKLYDALGLKFEITEKE